MPSKLLQSRYPRCYIACDEELYGIYIDGKLIWECLEDAVKPIERVVSALGFRSTRKRVNEEWLYDRLEEGLGYPERIRGVKWQRERDNKNQEIDEVP